MRGPILKLLSATGYASVVGYLGMLALVRLYPEASFGLFDLVISIVGILTPFVSLRYEDTLMLAEAFSPGSEPGAKGRHARGFQSRGPRSRMSPA